jgi:hypothetical protein
MLKEVTYARRGELSGGRSRRDMGFYPSCFVRSLVGCTSRASGCVAMRIRRQLPDNKLLEKIHGSRLADPD